MLLVTPLRRDPAPRFKEVSNSAESWLSQVLRGAYFRPSIASTTEEGRAMFYAVLGYVHTALWRVNLAVTRRVKAIHALAGERGQGTVEYVGLILLVSLLMVGMVAAMKGFNGKQGTELADVIINKIKEAVDKVAFK
jgi:hypothetical protein